MHLTSDREACQCIESLQRDMVRVTSDIVALCGIDVQMCVYANSICESGQRQITHTSFRAYRVVCSANPVYQIRGAAVEPAGTGDAR